MPPAGARSTAAAKRVVPAMPTQQSLKSAQTRAAYRRGDPLHRQYGHSSTTTPYTQSTRG